MHKSSCDHLGKTVCVQPFCRKKAISFWVMGELCIILHWVSAHCLNTRSYDTGTDKYKICANWHACNLRVQGFGRRSGMGCKALCLAQCCCNRPCSLRFMLTVGGREHQQCRVFQMHSWCLYTGWKWHITQETTSTYSEIF